MEIAHIKEKKKKTETISLRKYTAMFLNLSIITVEKIALELGD